VKVFDHWTSWPLAEAGLRARVPPDGDGGGDGSGGSGEPEARLAYCRRLAAAPPQAVLVKLADRLSNVQQLDRHPRPEKRRSYYRETVEWILPLADGVPLFAEQYARRASRFAELG
jgi:guanosine-3',5'-bis(diphosphate) 3'-pyrophosphohydrolase